MELQTVQSGPSGPSDQGGQRVKKKTVCSQLLDLKDSSLDILDSSVGLIFFLLDVLLDLVTAVMLCQKGSYMNLLLLLLLLFSSSLLVQVFSWLWYKYDEFKMHTKKTLKTSHLKLLHVFQLGLYVRHLAALEKSWSKTRDSQTDSDSACSRFYTMCSFSCKMCGCFFLSLFCGALCSACTCCCCCCGCCCACCGCCCGCGNKLLCQECGDCLESGLKYCQDEVKSFFKSEDEPKYLKHDLLLLRLIETFSKSLPQIILMLTIILQDQDLDHIAVVKIIVSLLLVTFCLYTYHRNLRSCLMEKQQSTTSSMVFSLWNLLLLSSRIVALSLFASVLSSFIFAHFFCSWLLLFFVAWRCKTEFMECRFGEVLFRATVGLIWYFDSFSVVKRLTLKKMLLYHSYILADICLLCGLCFWKISTASPLVRFSFLQLYPATTSAIVVGVYILGLMVKMSFYNVKRCHRNVQKEELRGGGSEEQQSIQEGPQLWNKRMRHLSESFYCTD